MSPPRTGAGSLLHIVDLLRRCHSASRRLGSGSRPRPQDGARGFAVALTGGLGHPTVASIGFVNGKPAGSAAPLTWGAGSFVRLVADLTAHRSVEKPSQTVDRYVTHQQHGTTLTVTAPADQSAATGTVTVTGTAAP